MGNYQGHGASTDCHHHHRPRARRGVSLFHAGSGRVDGRDRLGSQRLESRRGAEAQAEPPTLALFCARLREGPTLARVSDVDTHEISVVEGDGGFEVRY